MIPAIWFPASLGKNLNVKIGDQLTDGQAMQLAVQEAYRGLGFVSPNPLVGCVVLDASNKFIASGYHAKVGEGHAEVNAIKGLSNDVLRGAKVFVTLEPCAHQGKTPSCAKMLAKLPIQKVIFGLVDPNPLVAGQGAEIIRAAGIEVEEFKNFKEELEQVCEHFLWNFREKKPFVTLKVASSLDGQMGLKSGESKWITDSTSREVSHILRAAHDAIMVGSQTVLLDDPSLDVRYQGLEHKKLIVFVLDPDGLALKKSAKLKITSTHARENLFYITSSDFSDLNSESQHQVLKIKMDKNSFNLDELLTSLWKMGVRSLFVEGGAHTLSSFILQKKAQRMYIFQAPVILGAKSGKSWSEQVSIKGMEDKISLKCLQILKLEADLLITGKFS